MRVCSVIASGFLPGLGAVKGLAQSVWSGAVYLLKGGGEAGAGGKTGCDCHVNQGHIGSQQKSAGMIKPHLPVVGAGRCAAVLLEVPFNTEIGRAHV